MKHLPYIIVGLICLIVFQNAEAQSPKIHKNYSEHYFKNLRYGLYTPLNIDANRSYPLIVYLHGSRDTVSRDISYYQEEIQKSNPSFVLTPKCDEPNLGWGDTWHEGHTIAMTKTLSLIDSLVQHYHLDITKLYIYGISMGGFGVFSVLAKEQNKFAAGYAICGGSDPKVASKLLSTPLWIFHGEKDDIVPVYLSQNIYKEIVRLGGEKVHYTEYPGVKHNSWENALKEKSLNSWLFSQRKIK